MIEQFTNFISTYLINPIANNFSYNIYNSILYTVILFIFIFLLKNIFKITKIEINNIFLLSLIPFFVLDVLLRLINDTNVFDNSFYVFLFSTPLIYLVLIFLVLFSFFLGRISDKLFKNNYQLIAPIPLLIYFLFFSLLENQIAFPKHISFVIEIIVSCIMVVFFYALINKSQLSAFYLTTIFSGLYSVIMCLLIFCQLYGNFPPNLSINESHQMNFIFLFGIGTFIILIIKTLKVRYHFIKEPLIIFLIIAMGLDAFATYLSFSLGNNPQHLITKLILSKWDSIYMFFMFKIIILFFITEFIKKIIDNGINIFSYKENNNFIRLTIIVLIVINFTTSIRVITKSALGF